MAKIGFIAPTRQIYELAKFVIDKMDLASTVILRFGDIATGVDVARELQEADVDVLLSRGGVAAGIQNADDIVIPVMEIAVTSDDLSQAIQQCRDITGLSSPKIALIPFAGVKVHFQTLSPFLQMNISYFASPSNREEVLQAVKTAIAEGADAIVGGTNATSIGMQLGIPSALLTSGELGISIAITEALKMAHMRQAEKERIQQIQMLIDRTPEGLLTVDRKGVVLTSNPAAAQSLGERKNFAGRNIRDLVPGPDWDACLNSGAGFRDTFMESGRDLLMVSAWPFRVGDEIRGAVVTVQEAKRITDMENKIRKELYTKGLVTSYSFNDIVGESPQLRESIRVAEQYAATSSTILIAGETGTGKELFAQAIHSTSPRSQGPFVAVNCAALPPSLLESELFGYEEGAFTGAVRKGKPGLFELAQGGTIFLDEISEMDNYGQTRLLRILQERCIMRLGGGSYVPLDIRVLAASNKNLYQLAQENKFRADLYYRLNLLTLHLPALRDRKGDILLLVKYFTERFNQKYHRQIAFSKQALERMADHAWPGNVRELQNVVERLILSSRSLIISADELAAALHMDGRYTANTGEPVEAALSPREAKLLREKEQILDALKTFQGNQKQAADSLGIDRSTLSRKMQKFGIRKTIAV